LPTMLLFDISMTWIWILLIPLHLCYCTILFRHSLFA